jgi:hypothetical protein
LPEFPTAVTGGDKLKVLQYAIILLQSAIAVKGNFLVGVFGYK